MEEFEKSGRGCYGLAANQLGIDASVAYAKIPKENGEFQEITLINPKIVETEDPIINPNEGCMSFPGKRVTTKRFNSVTIENYNGKFMFDGLEAIVVQHEIDHFTGNLIIDSGSYCKTLV